MCRPLLKFWSTYHLKQVKAGYLNMKIMKIMIILNGGSKRSKKMNQIEKKLYTYKMLIPAAPYPFEGKATAFNLDQAFRKIQFQAKQCGLILKRGKPIQVEKMKYCGI